VLIFLFNKVAIIYAAPPASIKRLAPLLLRHPSPFPVVNAQHRLGVIKRDKGIQRVIYRFMHCYEKTDLSATKKFIAARGRPSGEV
jgi:hypothetical protein